MSEEVFRKDDIVSGVGQPKKEYKGKQLSVPQSDAKTQSQDQDNDDPKLFDIT